jgi:energy-coupling factor transporter ATP-binding protein EcfA2
MLQIDRLHVELDTDSGLLRAIDGLRLTLQRGETFALVGESGCGKRMTALALTRLLPESGRVAADILGGPRHACMRRPLAAVPRLHPPLQGDVANHQRAGVRCPDSCLYTPAWRFSGNRETGVLFLLKSNTCVSHFESFPGSRPGWMRAGHGFPGGGGVSATRDNPTTWSGLTATRGSQSRARDLLPSPGFIDQPSFRSVVNVQ